MFRALWITVCQDKLIIQVAVKVDISILREWTTHSLQSGEYKKSKRKAKGSSSELKDMISPNKAQQLPVCAKDQNMEVHIFEINRGGPVAWSDSSLDGQGSQAVTEWAQMPSASGFDHKNMAVEAEGASFKPNTAWTLTLLNLMPAALAGDCQFSRWEVKMQDPTVYGDTLGRGESGLSHWRWLRSCERGWRLPLPLKIAPSAGWLHYWWDQAVLFNKGGLWGLFVFLWKNRGLQEGKPGQGALHLKIVINLTRSGLIWEHRWCASKLTLPEAWRKSRKGGPEMSFRCQHAQQKAVPQLKKASIPALAKCNSLWVLKKGPRDQDRGQTDHHTMQVVRQKSRGKQVLGASLRKKAPSESCLICRDLTH